MSNNDSCTKATEIHIFIEQYLQMYKWKNMLEETNNYTKDMEMHTIVEQYL